jgi:cyclic pyranopterin phosphate synthase
MVLDRDAPGIAEAIRADARTRTPHALLSRGLAGLRGTTLVVNLPGSPGGCRDGFAVLQPALGHGLELAAGDQASPHRQT